MRSSAHASRSGADGAVSMVRGSGEGGSGGICGRSAGPGERGWSTPETVRDGETGLLLPPGDSAAWAEATQRLLDDSESERMGDAGRDLWSEHYSPERGLQGIERVYREALAR